MVGKKKTAISNNEQRESEDLDKLGRFLAKKGLDLLQILEEFERRKKSVVEEVVRAEERKKIAEIKKKLG